MSKSTILNVGSTTVRFKGDSIDSAYFCLTDMARATGDPRFVVKAWLRTRSTLAFIRAWELKRNDNFKEVEFDLFRNNAGDNNFTVSIDQLGTYNCTSIFSRKGRYGGSYGHIAIAFHFANWLSPEFYHDFVTSFIESNSISVKRLWSRLNYRLQTEAIKYHLPSPKSKSSKSKVIQFANEADILNSIVFGETAREWKARNPKLKGNQRDHANQAQLHVLANLEVLNAYHIRNGTIKESRVSILVREADYQFDLFYSAYPNLK